MLTVEENEIGILIQGMKQAYLRGENMMAWAKLNRKSDSNSIASTLISYDFQAGSYVSIARTGVETNQKWCKQLAHLLAPHIEEGDKILEAGVGEATTLVGVMQAIGKENLSFFGFDLSWSRIKIAKEWANDHAVKPELFVGDLFHIPIADNAIDVIYTSHSLEPNSGKELLAMRELLRVARKAVILVEPIYELASEAGQKRMVEHGYVRNLKAIAEAEGMHVEKYGLLDYTHNSINPSGIVLISKPAPITRREGGGDGAFWQCPLTACVLINQGDVFYASDAGIAYPVMRDIPLLRKEHAVVASKLDS